MELNASTAATYMLASFLSQAEPLEVPINDYFCMVEAVTHESMGEPLEGKQAVAAVIMNRVDRMRGQETVCEVVHARGQFSYRKGLPVDIKNKLDAAAFADTLQVAYDAVQGKLADPTNGADHYFNPRTARRYSWMDAGESRGVIGRHEFRRLLDENGNWM